MNDNVPGTGDGSQQPSNEPYGAESTSEPTRPIHPAPYGDNDPTAASGFGQQQPHQPGYQPGYGPHGYGFGGYPQGGGYPTGAGAGYATGSGYQGGGSYPPGGSYQSGNPQQPGGPEQPAAAYQGAGQQPPVTPPAAPPTRADRPRRRPGLAVASLALAALVGAGAGVGSYAYLGHGSAGSVASPITVTTQKPAQQAKTNGTVEDAAKVIEPSVVTITVQAGSSGDIGSGVVLDKKGHILTNDHVVSAASQDQSGFPGGQTARSKITVTFSNGRTAAAHVVGTDETDDLAVLKVSGGGDLTPANFAKSSSLSVGQSVVAVGAPLGLSQTVTSGIVSNTARPVRSGQNNDAVYMAVQTDAAINPGNSGGPLVDLNGSVVGINSSIASTAEESGSGSQSGNIGIGFAIPADVAVRVSSELIANGKSADAMLGVTINGTDNGALGSTTTGVALESVNAGSAAAKAGLKAGDVVTELNGFKVTTADGLIAATHYYAPGTTVKVTYQRDGQTHTTQATLGSA
jgi:putative serine protease PepD